MYRFQRCRAVGCELGPLLLIHHMRKTISTLVVVPFLIFANFAHAADFSGFWAGTGEVQMFIGDQDQGSAPCSIFEYTVEQTSIELKVSNGHFHCGAEIEAKFDPRVFVIEQETLWLEGKQVGSIRGERIQLDFQNGNEMNSFEAELLSDGIHYRHTWSDGYTKLVMQGILKKQ